jgi:YHS domain-containing protein/uncharacterized membrane protein
MQKIFQPGLSALVLATIVVTVTATPSPPEAGTTSEVQVMCPVLTDEKVDPDISVEYNGQTVYLCCQKCRVKFEAAPERYVSNIVTVSQKAISNKPDHGQGHGQGQGSPAQLDVLSALGRFHPIAIHFPIALLVSAALARCLMLMGWVGWAAPAVRFCVLLGGVSAVGAAVLGWLNAGYPAEGEALGDVLFNHRWLGVSTAVMGVLLIVLVEKEARCPSKALSRLTTLALLVGAGLVGATGHFGGIMVFGPDYLPW